MGDALEFIITHPVSDVFIMTLAFWIYYVKHEAQDGDRLIVRISQVLIGLVIVLMNIILLLVYTVRIPPDFIRFLVSLTIGTQVVAAIASAISLRRKKEDGNASLHKQEVGRRAQRSTYLRQLRRSKRSQRRPSSDERSDPSD